MVGSGRSARDWARRGRTWRTASPGDLLVAFASRRSCTRVARSLAADIRFEDPTVSRRHALIVQQPDGLRLVDESSLNGVFVNGRRVDWSTLADGDEIKIGAHHLRFMAEPALSSIAGDRREAADVAAAR